MRWLQEELRCNWLLVLDDLSFESFPEEEKSQLLEALKGFKYSSGRLLTTSTISEWEASSSSFDVIQLPTLPREECFQVLKGRLIDTSLTDDEKSSIGEVLDHHPLALHLASSYLLESEDITKSAGALLALKPRGPLDTIAPQDSVLDLSLDQLKHANPSALELLYLISVLDIQGIPITLLTLCGDTWYDNWRLVFRRAIRKLLSSSLIRSSLDQFTLFLDEPTQIYIHKKLDSDGTLAIWQQKAVQILSEIFPDGNSTYWRQCETLLPHTKAILVCEPTDDDSKSSKVSRAILLRKLGKYNKELGDYGETCHQKMTALEIYQKVYGANAPSTLEVEKEVADVLYKQGKTQESETMLVRVLAGYKSFLPENHYLILTHYNSLSAVVQDLGKLEQAEEYAEKARQGYEQIYGPTHADTLIAKWNLATLYNKRSRYKDASNLFQDILQAYREIYDETHPYVLETRGALATSLLDLNENDRAIKMLQESVPLALQTLGATQPIVLALQGRLANALSSVGRLGEAETLQRQILNTTSSLHPAPQPQSLVPALNLACTLEKLSRFKEACAALEPASKLAANILSSTDPTLLRIQRTLALIYLRLGQNAEAESQFRKLVETNKLTYGENGQQTLVTMNNLGGALQRQEKYAEAVEVQKNVLEGCKEALGEKARLTMRAGNNLAETLRMWAESGVERSEELLDEASKLHSEVLESRKEILGEALDTWISSVNLGTVLQIQSRRDEAMEYFDVLEKLEGVAGSDNEVVKRGKERLALLAKGKSEG